MSAPKTKFNFQTLMTRPKGDASTVSSQLQIICNAINEVYNQNSSQLSFEQIYGTAYKLVLQKQGDVLYERLREVISKHLKSSVQRLQNENVSNFLAQLVEEWELHRASFQRISDVLMYVDRTYCEQKKKAPIFPMALALFRDTIVYDPPTRERIRMWLLKEILSERQGCIIDRQLIKETLLMLVKVGITSSLVYEEEFERLFLLETEKFYHVESFEYVSVNSCPDYMSKVERRLAEESERVTNYLAPETEVKLRAILDAQLLTQHCRTLIDMESSGVYVMYRDMKLDELRRFYALFSRVPACFDLIKDSLGTYIVQSGEAILTEQETSKDPVLFVKRILDLKDQFDQMLNISLRSEKKLQKKIKESFMQFINKDHRTASHLAAYLDDFLRTGVQGLQEIEVETQLDKVIVIFNFVSDKDLFESYYKNALAKRLLNNKAISDEVEKLMIAKLKAECGYQYTTKLEGMFVDMNLSKANNEDFKRSRYPALLAPLELDVTVLTTGFWPLQSSSQQNVTFALPSPLKAACAVFTDFYNEKNSGRKLAWYPSHSNVDIKAHFPLGRKDLNVTTYQIAVLLLFNQRDTWTYEELRQATELPENELKRHLLSLCTPKLRILNKSSRGKVQYMRLFVFDGAIVRIFMNQPDSLFTLFCALVGYREQRRFAI